MSRLEAPVRLERRNKAQVLTGQNNCMIPDNVGRLSIFEPASIAYTLQ